MAGVPVYLASVSRRSPLVPKKPVATGLWSKQTRDDMAALLQRVVGPAGNPARERLFRMNVTLCLHRALRTDELEQLPDWFWTAAPVDLAGGPVEILSETEPGLPTTKPCVRPTHRSLWPGDPWLWFPEDCGHCPPCRARVLLQAERDDLTGAAPLYLEDTLREAGV
jgi:hypothetical protein